MTSPKIMRYSTSWNLDNPVPKNCDAHLSDCELYVIYLLGDMGSKRIYGLAKTSKVFPKVRPRPLSWGSKHKNLAPIRNNNISVFSDSAFYQAVKKLEEKELVKRRKQSSDVNKFFIELTFFGLLVYLVNIDDEDRYRKALYYYSKLFPFSLVWNDLTDTVGVNKCFDTLQHTVDNLHLVELIISLDSDKGHLTYAQTSSIKDISKPKPKGYISRDPKVVKFLRSENGLDLKNSYIMHLFIEDLNNKKFLEIESDLNPDKELAYIEGKQIEDNSVFKRATEFYPEYVDAEHVFTGIFVKKLLWNLAD